MGISEYFRRRSRIEAYAKEIFQKRLAIYEALFHKINKARNIASDIFQNPDYSKDKRYSIWSDVVMEIAEHNDKNELYLNDEISLHCLSTIIGVDEYYYIKDPKEKENHIQQFRNNCTKLISMIKDESGLSKMHKLFGTITKAKHQSDFIAYYREMKKKYAKEGASAFKDTSE